MSKFTCNDCGAEFDEPDEEMVDLEDYYGVGGLFGDHHSGYMDVCPECGSEDIEEN